MREEEKKRRVQYFKKGELGKDAKIQNVYSDDVSLNGKAILKRIATQQPGKSRPFGTEFYQPASFLRDLSVSTRQAFNVALTFSPVTALAAKEGTLSCWL